MKSTDVEKEVLEALAPDLEESEKVYRVQIRGRPPGILMHNIEAMMKQLGTRTRKIILEEFKHEYGGACHKTSGVATISPSLSNFISLISARSRQDSVHGKERQTVSSLSPTRPILGGPRLSRLKSFFSLLLSSNYPFKALSELKYDKVVKFIGRDGITW